MTMSDSNGKQEVTEEIEVNYKKREIKPAEGMGGNIEEFYAIEAVDQAELCFFVLQRDVTYVKCGQDAYIQAKLQSIDDEDLNSNGKGIAQSSVTLYKVSEPLKSKQSGDPAKSKKKSLIREPKTRDYANFNLNQSFLRTQENKDVQLWNVNPSMITSDHRFIGSIIYEENGTDELVLNMVTARLKQ